MAIYSSPNSWVIETNNTAYSLALRPDGLLVHRYWGARLKEPADYPAADVEYNWPFNSPGQWLPEEYPAPAGLKYIEPCLKALYADGTRDSILTFVESILPDPETLVISLIDTHYQMRVNLFFRAYPAIDIIERWAEVENLSQVKIDLQRVFSAQWHLPLFGNYRLSHMSGRWLDESHIQRQPLNPGLTTVLESRRITTGHHAHPWFAIDRGSADEDQGEVWFGVLAWSGNWKISAECTDFDSTRISIGLNDWDFLWNLMPGETFAAPSSFAGYTKNGFGAASRQLHDLIRTHFLPHGPSIHKVIYNSWEATLYNVDTKSQSSLAELAARMGVELFVMDDGWFEGRKDDHAGLGDWQPDAVKFPDGLGPLIEKVNSLGMDFGLWVEPEMVNPNSALYRAHPDWVIHFENRERTLSRNQLVLNLGREDVQNYLIGVLDKLLSDNNIAFIKWDMNRNVSEPGWPGAERDPRELWVRYVAGVYRVWDTLRRRHPAVIWQSCSGGGGRADLGILRLADQIWASDNTEATARLVIQEGFSQVFPAMVMEAWVTDAAHERISMDFRFHVSMCGSLGVGGHLTHWTEAERERAAHWISIYKEIRMIIHFGDLYRLLSPARHSFSALEYVSKDQTEAVVFAFRTHIPEPITLPSLKLHGLNPDYRYVVDGQPAPRSGAAWMEDGLRLSLKDFESAVIRIRRQS